MEIDTAGAEAAAGAGVEDSSHPGCRDAADTLAHLASAFKTEDDAREAGDRDAGDSKSGKRSNTAKPACVTSEWEGGTDATPEKKRRKTDASPASATPKSRTTPGPPQADSHFIVHLFVTAIAGGKLQQGLLPQKTWDVLHQVVTKVSKEQNTTVTLHGIIHEFKMRVFVCNSVEARAVGEYITSHPDQNPAPLIVLARQLSMAISYNSASLDPSQAAVADRLRKQAKTRAVKEMREAVRECQMTITHAMLKGHCGAMAPVKELEPQLLKKSTRMDLEGDPNRRYFVFAAKNRSREDSDKVKQEPHHGTSTVAMPTPPPLPAFAFNVAQAGALQAGAGGHANPQSVVSERLEALLGGAQTSRPRERASEQLGALLGGALGAGSSVSRPPAVQQAAAVKQEVPGMGSVRVPASPVRPVNRNPGSPLSPGGRDGAAALLSLFNAVSAGSASKQKLSAGVGGGGAGEARTGASPQKHLGFGDEDEGHTSGGSGLVSVNKAKVERGGGGGGGGGKMSLAAQAAANVLRTPGGDRGTPRKALVTLDTETFDVGQVVMKFADSPTFKARSLKLSVELPPVLELSPALKTPRTVSTSKMGTSLYGAVKAGDVETVKRMLLDQELVPSQLHRAVSTLPDDFYSRSSNNSNLVAGCQVEIEMVGKWLEGTVLKLEGDKVQVHLSESVMGGTAGDEWVELNEANIRPPSEGGLHGFTPLMCACSLEDGERARDIVELLLENSADVTATDNHGNTCVHWAAMAGHAEVIRLLASGGKGGDGARGDMNKQTVSTGDTPLLLAARSGHSEAVRLLIDKGADASARNYERVGLMELAGERRQDQARLRESVLDEALKLAPSLRTHVFHHPDCEGWEGGEHGGGKGEGGRVRSILRCVEAMPEHRVSLSSSFGPASDEMVEAVHSSSSSSGGAGGAEDVGARGGGGEAAFVCAARAAAGAACHAVDEVLGGKARNAFCCVAPPGHLSGPSQGGSGGELNCAAIAAMHALRRHGGTIKRVAIVDLDAQHGSGTEEWARGVEQVGSILLCSSHVVVDEGSEGTPGRADDLRSFVVNEPLNAVWRQQGSKRGDKKEFGRRVIGSGRAEYREQMTRRLVPCLRAFCPDLVILSVGFNGRSGDAGNPSYEGVDGLDLVDEDYYWATQQVMRVASVCCRGKLVSILEGGSGVAGKGGGRPDYSQLASAASHHVRALTGF